MSSVINRLFIRHPNSVGETYFEHLGSAMFFASRMFVGSFVCLLHALLPFLFVKTGSCIVEELHHKMITARHRHSPATVETENHATPSVGSAKVVPSTH